MMPDFCDRHYPFHYTTALNILAKMGVDIDRIDLLAVGPYENYKGEVNEQSPAPGTVLQDDTHIVLKVGYPSAVDFMPYQFFFGLVGSQERTREWEDHSRHLMAPYDASVIRHDAQARFEILKFSHGFIDLGHMLDFLKLFEYEPGYNDSQIEEALAWVALMPSFHFWAGNPKLVEKALKLIFGYDFEIRENTKTEYSIPEAIHYHLGSKAGRLGRESLMGKTFVEFDSSYVVIIHNLHVGELRELLPGGSKRRRIEAMLGLCMPNNLEYKIKYDVADKKLILGKETRKGYLGYATYI